MSDHRGRVEAIVRAASDRPLDMMNLIFVIRQNLRDEHDEGWREGYSDGLRDTADAKRHALRAENAEAKLREEDP